MIVWFIATVRREFPADNDEFENVKINCDLFELDCVSDLTLNGESLEPLGITEVRNTICNATLLISAHLNILFLRIIVPV